MEYSRKLVIGININTECVSVALKYAMVWLLACSQHLCDKETTVQDYVDIFLTCLNCLSDYIPV